MDEIIVDASWLAGRLDDPDVRVVDVRDAWEYDALGHVPGAVNVPFDAFRSDGDADAGHLPGAEAFADLLGEAGLSRDRTLVAYDDTNGVFAARFLVTALVYGYDDVRLLNGDFSSWKREHEVSDEAASPDPVAVEPERVTGRDSPLVDAERVRAAVAGDGVLVDTRDREEYEAGHLPGAVRFDWTEAVDPETRGVRDRETLRELFAERGVTPDHPVILYCNTARRLSHTYVVLRWLGFRDVGIYEGSLTEWRARDGDLVTGPAPRGGTGEDE
ncbi:sulfurtransferase [Haloparvum alkalitolerans]|uniref:sulfurtransferase n=1 Tax=Haloparvum alkalitolerans TaxID=1042953 RepID=UPI003CEFBBC4